MQDLLDFLMHKLDSDYMAKVISNVGSPPVWMLGTAVFTTLATQNQSAWVYLMWYALPIILLPTLYTVYLFKIGSISDLHIKKREERIKPMFATMLATLGATIGLNFTDAPVFIVLIAIAISCQMIGMALLTLSWKISLHSTSATTCVIMGYWLNPVVGLVLFPLLIAVIWARLHLKYHTIGQIAGGIILSTATVGTALYIFSV